MDVHAWAGSPQAGIGTFCGLGTSYPRSDWPSCSVVASGPDFSFAASAATVVWILLISARPDPMYQAFTCAVQLPVAAGAGPEAATAGADVVLTAAGVVLTAAGALAVTDGLGPADDPTDDAGPSEPLHAATPNIAAIPSAPITSCVLIDSPHTVPHRDRQREHMGLQGSTMM